MDAMAAAEPGANPAPRPVLDSRADDEALPRGALTVIVPRIGQVDRLGRAVFLEGLSGRIVASTRIAAPAAPADLTSKMAKVRQTVATGAAVQMPSPCR
ncbi:hypothetical protein RZN05_01920 [Sphingomonas sp. HF-S4]|uniref:Uncharacterized protein n=1 Tax=Sphingomonas agrestis TaxID=3080540 RepID=A0ABU3Y367_9SPHN|nr:hypothetical protein [Sphingomonas sp. HF-S4]MDV3455726.1 hypothetical protein [Sphingomonas sp. HF-S4]